MVLATFDRQPLDGDAWKGTHVRLTADGADLFFRAYHEGDPLDDFLVHVQQEQRS
jgi:hypothetical protein